MTTFRGDLPLQLSKPGIGCHLLDDGSMRLHDPQGSQGPLTWPGHIVAHDIERRALR